MDLKIFLGISAGVLTVSSFIPYFSSILTGRTAPHSYTWLIWSITQSLAAVVIFHGGGGIFSSLSVGAGALLSLVVFLASLTRGTEHIHAFDSVILIVALLATILWWRFDHPTFSIIMVSFIDAIGFIPTYRKTLIEPRSESLLAWTLYLVGNICALLALTHYNLLTILYIATMIGASSILIALILLKR